MTSAEAPGEPDVREDPLAEALRLIDLGAAAGLYVRLMGGLAFHAQAPTWVARIDRDGRDIDLATRSRDRRAVIDLLVGQGYTPDRQYNALYGHKQLYFVDQPRNRAVDVLVDQLEMCHRFGFADRLGETYPTLPLADLLLSKLQIVRLNRKDVLDALILMAEHPLGDGDGSPDANSEGATINMPRIVAIASNDWGWWRTLSGNLDALVTFLANDLAPGELDVGRPIRFDPASQIAVLRSAIDAAPKSTRWKLRARIGDRLPWYEEPEEVGHGR